MLRPFSIFMLVFLGYSRKLTYLFLLLPLSQVGRHCLKCEHLLHIKTRFSIQDSNGLQFPGLECARPTPCGVVRINLQTRKLAEVTYEFLDIMANSMLLITLYNSGSLEK